MGCDPPIGWLQEQSRLHDRDRADEQAAVDALLAPYVAEVARLDHEVQALKRTVRVLTERA